MEHETAEQLSAELKRTIRALDHELDALATTATKLTASLVSLADLTGRIRRMVDDPPAERHTLEIHDGKLGNQDSNPPAPNGDDPGAN
jgi:hypothetical protein